LGTSSLLAISLVVAPLATIASQEPLALRLGDRVRLQAPSVSGGAVVGTLVSLQTDSLVVQGSATTWHFSLASITRLELNRGRKSHALSGAGIGLIVGVVVGVVWGKQAGCDEDMCVTGGAAVGGGGGALLGAVIGSLVRTERWAVIPLDHIRLGFTPDIGRGLRLKASLGF